MSYTVVKPEEFSKVLVGILDDYGREVMEGTKKAVDKTTKELVEQTKQTAPKKAILGRPAGTFARHISSKQGTSTSTAYSKIWYVKSPEYRLAHLLNNGHALRQGGRWEGKPFITQAANEHAVRFEKRIREVIQDAGK